MKSCIEMSIRSAEGHVEIFFEASRASAALVNVLHYISNINILVSYIFFRINCQAVFPAPRPGDFTRESV